ncbi:MAG: methyltransferase domain-containing protein, partial [Candidatus Rokuibacteriota bacterium]
MAGCRFCGTRLSHTLVDLGMSPLCESFLTREQLNKMEPFFPLHAYVCGECFLVQVEEYVGPERIFDEYAYFSSYSDAWLQHARSYTDMIVSRLGLDGQSHVVELGSNDGYLLQYFVAKGIPVLGVEPAANVAAAAVARGVASTTRLFGRSVARDLVGEGKRADLIIGNNVLAQVTDLNGFVAGMKLLLKPRGVITMEFPHLVRLVEENQFDTIYHEHLCYFSLLSAESTFRRHGLEVFDVDTLPTHGGSLRVHVARAESGRKTGEAVLALRRHERERGLDRIETYSGFDAKPRRVKERLLGLLDAARREGKRIAAYGAAAKGNTLLNYCGIGPDRVEYVVDRNPHKQGLFLPGSRIPVCPPERLRETRPDVLLLLPWNLLDELVAQLAFVRQWGGK